jgi:hypothetical protein
MVERRGLQREAAAEGEIKDPPLKNGSSLIQAAAPKQKTAPLELKGAAPGSRDDSARIVRVQPIGWRETKFYARRKDAGLKPGVR